MKQKLFTLLIALLAITGTANAGTYDIRVGDVQVTDANKADVLGDGTVTYNSATNKLTLNNAKIVLNTDNKANAGISVGINGLEIVLEGSNRIEATNGLASYGIHSYSYTGSSIVFSGTGSLYIEGCVPGDNYITTCGIHSSNVNDGTITINGGDITVACNGDWAIFSENDIVINGGTVTVLSSKGGGIIDNHGTTINGGIVMAETSGSSLKSLYGNIEINGGKITMKSTNLYGIISNLGRVDITGGTVTATSKSANSIDAGKSVNIKGGTVTASSENFAGISCDKIVNIEGGIVEATGRNVGICGKEGLSVYSTARLLEGDAAPGAVVSALTNTYALSTSSIFWTKKYVKISPRLVITTQPQNVTIYKGGTATLSVVVTGGKAPYTYQWRQYNNSNKKWEPISGATSSTFNVKPTETTMYYCEIHDADANQLLSDNATVTVKDPLTITKQPENVTIIKGGMVTLSVTAAGGTKPYTYQWMYKVGDGRWTEISGATSITYSPVTTADGVIEYRCVIGDAAGYTVFSNEVTVTVKSDVTAPTVSDKTITVKEVTSSRIWVTWNAAKDNITALASMKYKVFCVDEGAQGLAIMLVFETGGKVEELPVSYESTGARSATVTKYIDKDMKLQNLEPGKEYVIMIYALDKAGNYADYDPVTVKILATGIDNATADDEKTVSDVKYFAPDGRAVTATAKGLVIRCTIYTDGTVKTDKVRK